MDTGFLLIITFEQLFSDTRSLNTYFIIVKCEFY